MIRLFFDPRRSCATLVLGLVTTFAPAAFAQADPGGDVADKPAEPEETTPAPSDKSEAEKPADSEAAPAPKEEKGKDPGEPQPPRTERQRAIKHVGLEHLGGEAYPEPTTRGIHGGSMWLTMHGLQWPYMPYIDGEPEARIGFSGSVWVDTSYARTDSGRPKTDPNIKRYETQARFVLRVTPTYSTKEGWFAQGQGEFVANGAAPAAINQLADTDDLYVRAGKWNLFDVTAGRFQGWEVYHLGMALDLNTFERNGPYTNANPASQAQIYGVTNYWDRPNGPGNIAVHVYAPKPVEFIRLEVLEQLGNSGGLQQLALRTVGIVDWGMNLPGPHGYRLSVKAKGGFETGKDTPREQGEAYKEKVLKKGGGGSLQVVFDPYVDIGGGFARGILDRFNSLTGDLEFPNSHTTTTYGGFLNVAPIKRLVIGIGYHHTEQVTLKCTEEIPPAMPGGMSTFEDCSTAPTAKGKFDSQLLIQYFAAIQGEILPNLFAKLVLAHGQADYNKYSDTGVPPYTNETGELMGLPLKASARVRFMYLF